MAAIGAARAYCPPGPDPFMAGSRPPDDLGIGTPADAYRNILIGTGWMVGTTLCFVCVTVIVRYLGSDMPATQAAFLRYVLGTLFMLPTLAPFLRRLRWHPRLGAHVLRGVVHSVAVSLWFFAMARIPIAEVTAIGYISPIFVAIGASLFLNERMSWRLAMMIAAGLGGVLIILRPGFAEISIGHWAQLLAAPCFAASFLLAKKMTQWESPGVIVASLSLFCTLGLLPGALLHWRAPTLVEVAWLALTAIMATLGHICQTRAFRAAPISITQPVGFLQLVWAALLGMALFGEALDPFVFLGAALIVAAATLFSHGEARAARRSGG